MLVNKNLIRFYHLLFGAINSIALIAAFFYAMNSHAIEIYFSYFTVLSNIFATLIFLYLGLKGEEKGPKGKIMSTLYGASVLYMSITGIVFWTLLRNDHTLSATQWINFTLHGIMPIAVFVGWLIYSPNMRLKAAEIIKWLVFPILFVIYTLIRGPFSHWYPYPFLNPNSIGYIGVFKYVILILVGSYLISYILIWISNRKLKK